MVGFLSMTLCFGQVPDAPAPAGAGAAPAAAGGGAPAPGGGAAGGGGRRRRGGVFWGKTCRHLILGRR